MKSLLEGRYVSYKISDFSSPSLPQVVTLYMSSFVLISTIYGAIYRVLNLPYTIDGSPPGKEKEKGGSLEFRTCRIWVLVEDVKEKSVIVMVISTLISIFRSDQL